MDDLPAMSSIIFSSLLPTCLLAGVDDASTFFCLLTALGLEYDDSLSALSSSSSSSLESDASASLLAPLAVLCFMMTSSDELSSKLLRNEQIERGGDLAFFGLVSFFDSYLPYLLSLAVSFAGTALPPAAFSFEPFYPDDS